MEIVRELRSTGLVQGQDFDFSWHRSCYNQENDFSYLEQKPVRAEFTFYKEKYATFFKIKYEGAE